MNKKLAFILASIIIAAATGLAVASYWNDAPVVDEVPHIGAGYTYVDRQAYLFNPEHPPLAKDLAGIPLLFLPINQNIYNQTYQTNWPTDVNGEWNFGRTLIFHSGVNAMTLVRLARAPELIFFILTALIVFGWARKLYDDRAAFMALLLFAFAPTVLAHARLVTTDSAVLWGVTAATFFFIRYLQNQNRKNFWIAAIIFGLAQITKFSAFLLLPYFFGLAVVWGWVNGKIVRTTWRSIVLMIVGILVVVGPFYQFNLIHYDAQKQKADAQVILSTYGDRLLADPVLWASDKPILRPYAEFGMGILMIFQRNAGGNQTYFLGQVYDHAVKDYFPIVYFLKEPLPFLLLLILAVIGLFFSEHKEKEKHLKNWMREHFAEFGMLVWVLLYWLVSINANLNIGIRHLMPVYAFTAILIAGQVFKLWKIILRRRGQRMAKSYSYVIAGLLIWFLLESLYAFPHYLPYFNELGLIKPSYAEASWLPGGQNYVVDSNVDWGQSLAELAAWVDARNIQQINLDYFGWADQSYYLGNRFVWMQNGDYTSAQQFLSSHPGGGWLAVSATYYQQSLVTDHNYSWLQDYAPAAFIGNSIFVWHITPTYTLK
ncbi:MAG TPA: glycosyltransferase family 39 protein [Candidatus Paceibacterota bacterium]|nr:glycosyltransferase family 39 protein [Candidatus Paceibacterota bacterium]